MKIDFQQDLALGRLTVTMSDTCHGDSHPLIDTVQFNRFHEKISPDTATLAGAIIASRWCGEVLEFGGFRIGGDVAEAIRLIVPDARFIQPVDGNRRNLCEGHLDLLVAPATSVRSVLGHPLSERGLTRLVTWSGEFVAQATGSSAGQIAGEISTNADVLLPAWETSVCLGLLVGGLRLGAIVVPQPDREPAPDVERITAALRIVGVQVRTVAPEEHALGEVLRERVDEGRRQRPRREQQRPVRLAAVGSGRGRH